MASRQPPPDFVPPLLGPLSLPTLRLEFPWASDSQLHQISFFLAERDLAIHGYELPLNPLEKQLHQSAIVHLNKTLDTFAAAILKKVQSPEGLVTARGTKAKISTVTIDRAVIAALQSVLASRMTGENIIEVYNERIVQGKDSPNGPN